MPLSGWREQFGARERLPGVASGHSAPAKEYFNSSNARVSQAFSVRLRVVLCERERGPWSDFRSSAKPAA
jgi:hypothetical protein